MNVPIYSEEVQKGNTPEVLFWVGCAGSFDVRAQAITKAFAAILNKLEINYAVLGSEEMCTGDPARRAGNEFQFQMLAYQNIHVLNQYQIKKIITTCPHCFNTFKNEYPELGGHFDVIHHTTYLQTLMDEGKIVIKDDHPFKDKVVTYHDSCYLGRNNGIYEAPRHLIQALNVELREMKRCKKNGACCGAGGAQMFKEEEAGNIRVNADRSNEAIETNAEIISSACPFCNTMLTDGVKLQSKEEHVRVMDVAEMIIQSMK